MKGNIQLSLGTLVPEKGSLFLRTFGRVPRFLHDAIWACTGNRIAILLFDGLIGSGYWVYTILEWQETSWVVVMRIKEV